jgi:hypothetical protein
VVAAGGGLPLPGLRQARACVLRLLVETATHAGHLDLARESIDGHQHLVVSGDG